MVLTTRKALLAMAVVGLAGGLAGGGAVWAATQTFTDVPPSHPFYDEIEWGAANDIVDGYPDGSFKPGNVVTRQAAVAFLSRYNAGIEIVTSGPVSGTAAYHVGHADCPAGKRTIGGGGFAFSGDVALTDSYPGTASGLPAGGTSDAVRWYAVWESKTGGSLFFSGAVYAVCAPLPVP